MQQGYLHFQERVPKKKVYWIFLFGAEQVRVRVKWKWKSLSRVRLFATPWAVHGILQARTLEGEDFLFSRGSSQPRNWTQVSRIVGRFFTSWAEREAQESWSGQPIPSPGDLPNPGMEPWSPALQADSLPTELSGRVKNRIKRGK